MRVIRIKFSAYFILLCVVTSALSSCSPVEITPIYNGYAYKGSHSRGLCVSDSIVYTSGSDGKIGVFNVHQFSLIDSFSVPAEDLRAVQLGRTGKLIVMNSGSNGIVYKIDMVSKKFDTVLFEAGAFFDALKISNTGSGVLFGDPSQGQFVLQVSEDYGESWKVLENRPSPLKNEAGFAASNTNISQFENVIYIGTGAAGTARLLKSVNDGESWDTFSTPIRSGQSFGIYSIQFWSKKEGFIAGGSYVEQNYNDSIVFLTQDGGETWKNRSDGLPGYMSCITSSKNGKLIVVTGRLGVYYSTNKGKKWQQITAQPFYTAVVYNKKIYLSGKDGTFAIYQVQ